MSLIVILGTYAAYVAFWTRLFMHVLLWVRASSHVPAYSPRYSRSGFTPFLRSFGDILFFGRLFRVNDLLWVGEWTFHASFVMVLLRHLRYFVDPVPEWVSSLQLPGLIAGYLLPVSLIYVLAVRLLSGRELYTSRYNLFLLCTLLLISATGILMHSIYKPDVAGVKAFAVGMLTFDFVSLPSGALFLIHFLSTLLLVLSLPTHIFSAPLVMLQARRRESGLPLVIHGE